MSPPLLELRDVRRTFDGGRMIALAGVSATFQAHESVAIMGPSGSGKSTLVNILCGLDPPESGSVHVAGAVVRGRREWAALRARRIGIVFQQFNLLATLTARENVEAASLDTIGTAAASRAAAQELLTRVGIPHCADRRPNQLSGGERQRVAIARALAGGRDILVCDEPTGSLDQAAAHQVLDLLLRLHESARMALLIVTHDAGVAKLCRRRLTLVDGRIARDQRGAEQPRGAEQSRTEPG
jgi:ABC-type lipoprotein export system ATPase subunit